MKNCHVDLCTKPIDVAAVVRVISHPSCGAEVVFCGRVRENNDGRAVRAVSYDAFAPLVRSVLSQICTETQKHHGDDLRVAMIHRVGELDVGDVSVVVAVAAPHRAAAYAASTYAVEQLKARVPVWKLEHYQDGEGRWLPGNSLASALSQSPDASSRLRGGGPYRRPFGSLRGVT